MSTYNFKVGDKVFLYGNHSTSIATVDKVTPSGRATVNGIIFNSDGKERGGDIWYSHSIQPATEEEIKAFRERVKRQKRIAEAKQIIEKYSNEKVKGNLTDTDMSFLMEIAQKIVEKYPEYYPDIPNKEWLFQD